MKLIFVFPAILATILAAPLDDSKNARILSYENDNNGIDSYNFSFETSDGTSRQEQGQLKNIGAEDEAMSVRGSYSYLGPDGVQYTVNYIADENGFRPEGAHLPKSLSSVPSSASLKADDKLDIDIRYQK